MSFFHQVLKDKQPLSPPPVWLMRQAGRYLPEYRDLRAGQAGFMAAVLTPEIAAEITLQPIRRYPHLDAAIIFSDILVIPYALGMDVQFVKGEGPQMPALAENTHPLVYDAARLDPVMQALRLVRQELPVDKTLIGFAGSPWTVACYMISGRNHDDFLAAKRWAFTNDPRLDDLIDTLVEASADYLINQIKAGCDVIQLFDSWAGLLAGHRPSFEKYIIAPTKKIVAKVRAVFPDIPIIGFPRQAGTNLSPYVAETGIDAVGLDWSVDLEWAHKILPPGFPVQGNLDPILVVAGGQSMLTAIDAIKKTLADRPFVFNLGHGLVPQTPPEHVAQLLEQVKK